MPKSPVLEQKDFAREALIAATSKSKVGNFIEVIEEGDGLASYLFENNQKGYVGWRWSVTIFQADSAEPTVSEIVLMPGPDSLVAPDWVPWSERLADYKALQAELEAQAALDAEEAEEAEDGEDESEDDEVEIVDIDEDELLAPVADQSESSESDTEDAGQRPPRSRGRNRRGKNKKND